MKVFKPLYALFVFSLFLMSCRPAAKYAYTIEDFKKSIQPYLIDIVNTGVVGGAYSSLDFLNNNMENDDLEKLALAENPILRATALKLLLWKSEVNDFTIVMGHLDDTAVVATDRGEWGIYYFQVSDYMLDKATWKNEAEKNKTIDKVIREHNYLKSAYTILHLLSAKEKYYADIKKMAQRRLPFETVEFALYGLAKFKKKEDIPFIKEILIRNSWKMNEFSFMLMREFPDETYLEVLEIYAKQNLLRYHQITGHEYPSAAFFGAVASYKNTRSEAILQMLLHNQFMIKGSNDSDEIKQVLLESIWRNKCDAYNSLLKKIEPKLSDEIKKKVPKTSNYISPEFSEKWSPYYPAEKWPTYSYNY